MTAIDRARGFFPDPKFSTDPRDPAFALSFAGTAFFAVGLHPAASRLARRAPSPVIVLNRHDQFARLRRAKQYERMREVILARDTEFDGSANPMIARHGETDIALLDSALLLDELPPDAYTDPGFVQFLKIQLHQNARHD